MTKKKENDNIKKERLDLIPEDHKMNCANCSSTRREKNEKVTVTLSVHQVLNYTQDVELYPWEVRLLESTTDSEVSLEIRDRIINQNIDFKDVYSRENILDCEILDKPEGV